MKISTTQSTHLNIALLIDGDNAQPVLLKNILAETGKYGILSIRRIYGDWTASNMGGWKEALHTHAIQPIQQFRYTTGKNATDSAMIIDAMDIMYEGVVQGFCIVSSDSDYTRLATRIREKGFFVMGIGKKTTPRSFVNACQIFVYTENLLPETKKIKTTELKKSATANETIVVLEKETEFSELVLLLKNAFDLAVQENGWAFLGSMGNQLRQLDPGFDTRTYGFKQLSSLIKAFQKTFQVKESKRKDGTVITQIKLKE